MASHEAIVVVFLSFYGWTFGKETDGNRTKKKGGIIYCAP